MASPHAIVSGGSSGIGLALAKRLVAEGWNVSLVGRSAKKLSRTHKELDALASDGQRRVQTYAVDVADENATKDAVKRAIKAFGAPDMVVANAGLVEAGYFHSLPLSVYRRLMDVNYFGALHLIKPALPAMRRNHNGQIVLVSSGAGLAGIFGYSAYSPTKFAVRGLAEVLRQELKPDGIHVSAVYPPDTDTPQLAMENKRRPPETRMLAKGARVLSADDVAASIMKGLAKKQFSITPGIETWLLGFLHSVLRRPLNAYFDRVIRRAQAKRPRKKEKKK